MPIPSAPILVLGLGNDILTDDAIGLNVVRHLARQFDGSEEVHVRETMEMGLALLDFMVGYRDVILVDSIQTGAAAPGTLHEVDARAIQCLPERTPHFLGVGETLALGRMLGLPMPDRVRVFAIEVADPFTLGTEMTEPLRRALPTVIAAVDAAVQAMLQSAPVLAGVS
jgi:hydrogenase maturation protease